MNHAVGWVALALTLGSATGCKPKLFETVVNRVELVGPFKRLAPNHELRPHPEAMGDVGCGEKLFVQDHYYRVVGRGPLPDGFMEKLMGDLSEQTRRCGATVVKMSTKSGAKGVTGTFEYSHGRTSGEVSVSFIPKVDPDSPGNLAFNKVAVLE